MQPAHPILFNNAFCFAVIGYWNSKSTANNTYKPSPTQWIGKWIYYLEDPEENLSFEQILQPEYDRKFVKSKQEIPNFGNMYLTVWNKITIVNRSSKNPVLSELNWL